MDEYRGYCVLRIPDYEDDLSDFDYAAAIIVIANPDGKTATKMCFRGGNGGAYGVDILRAEIDLPEGLK